MFERGSLTLSECIVTMQGGDYGWLWMDWERHTKTHAHTQSRDSLDFHLIKGIPLQLQIARRHELMKPTRGIVLCVATTFGTLLNPFLLLFVSHNG